MSKNKATERPEDRLLRIAKREISRRGIQGAEVQHLAKAARTSTSQFHVFYQCRDNLLARVFDDGWQLIEQRMADRLMIVNMDDLPGVFVALVEAVLDAYEDEPDAVGSTLVLAFATAGQAVRQRLHQTQAFKRYREVIAKRLVFRMMESGLTPTEAQWAHEFVFGAISRALFLLTPLAQREHKNRLNRDEFTLLIRRMVTGLLEVKVN